MLCTSSVLVSVLTVLNFAFCLYPQHKTKTFIPPQNFFYFIRNSLSWLLAFCPLFLLHNAHNINIHAPGGIQTRKSNKRSTTDPRLRRPGRWDRPEFEPPIFHSVDRSLHRLCDSESFVFEIYTKYEAQSKLLSVTSRVNIKPCWVACIFAQRPKMVIFVCKNHLNDASSNGGRILEYVFCRVTFCFWIVSKTTGELSFPYQLPTWLLRPTWPQGQVPEPKKTGFLYFLFPTILHCLYCLYCNLLLRTKTWIKTNITAKISQKKIIFYFQVFQGKIYLPKDAHRKIKGATN